MAKSKKFAGGSFKVTRDGVVDVEASCERFREAALEFAENHANRSEKVLVLVDKVLEGKKSRVSKELLVSKVVALMADDDAISENTDFVDKVIRANSSDKLDGKVLYSVTRGPGGGICTQELAATLSTK